MIKCGNIKGLVYNHVYSRSYIRYLTRKKSLARFKWLIFSFLHFCCIGESKKHSKMYISIDNVCGNVLLLSSLLSSYIKQPSAQIGWTDDGPSFIEFHRSTGGGYITSFWSFSRLGLFIFFVERGWRVRLEQLDLWEAQKSSKRPIYGDQGLDHLWKSMMGGSIVERTLSYIEYK